MDVHNNATATKLKRELGLFDVISANVIYMIGITPFVTIPIIGVSGLSAVLAWIVGGLLAFCDGYIWSELGAAYPKSGGSYQYLKKLFRPTFGNYLSFLYIWQIAFIAPLAIASIAIGFSTYFQYLFPLEGNWMTRFITVGSIAITFILVSQKIMFVGQIAKALFIGVILSLFVIIALGFLNFKPSLFSINNQAAIDVLSWTWHVAFGQAVVKCIYCYLGYYNSCHIAEEIKNPAKNIPRSILASALIVAIIYILLQIVTLGNLPNQEIQSANFVFSILIEAWLGKTIAILFTVFLLWAALACIFSITLGYSRVLYAAGGDGSFIAFAGRVDRKKSIPLNSIVWLSVSSAVASLFFTLVEVISAIVVLRIFTQFISQGIGLICLNYKKGRKDFPYKMPLFPLPVILSIIIWLFAFITSGTRDKIGALIIVLLGSAFYFVRLKRGNRSLTVPEKNAMTG